MIVTMIRLGWTTLKRDRVALFLTFLMPVIFFSIFAAIFGNLGGGGGEGTELKPLVVIAADEDGTEVSTNLIQAIAAQEALEVSVEKPGEEGAPSPGPWTRDEAYAEVRRGRATAAVVVPAGFAEQYGNFAQGGATVEVIYDASNPMARFTVSGLLQAAAFQAAPSVLMEKGFDALDDFGGGGLTPEQSEAITSFKSMIDLEQSQGTGTGGGGGAGAGIGLVTVQETAAHDDSEDGEGGFSMVAYYAAGIGVMFLLFSMTGAAGTLLDDQESGTLERLLSSNLTMTQLLGSRWLFFSLVGVTQVVVMFVWGALVFGLDLFTAKRLAGFGVMALATGFAAAAFGILLATLCQSRAQLSGLSTIVILIMSALGGSMVPRFVMPAFMDTFAKFTFNGWALDGFLKVFWYDDPEATLVEALVDLAPQAGFLALCCVVFLWVSRRLARRWERA